MNPLFSIVIPVYNTVRELKRCVDSITCQSFRDFEVLLVDDGSTDGSSALCDTLSAADSRVRTIHKVNGGCSEARNTGIRASTGKYLLFVDSDDMWDDENALADLAKIIEKDADLDVICFGVAIYDEDGKLVKIRKPELPAKDVEGKFELLKHMVYTNQYFSASYVKALRKEYFLRNDLFFRKGLVSGEDIDWSARVMVTCENIAVYPSAFYKRIRRFSGSITSSIQTKNVKDVLDAIGMGVQFAREHAEDDQMLDVYLEYWAYQYAMLLGLASAVKEKSEYRSVMERLEQFRWLLKYDHVNKVKAVSKLVSIVGVRAAVIVLSTYYSIGKR